MSQIPYIAIDEKIENLKIDNNVFSGTGKVVVPFNMIEITGYPKFSDFAEDEHIFVSILPLFDGQYWLFYFKGNLLIDRSQTENPYYYQNQILNNDDDFIFYYSNVRKPLQISNINLFDKVLPFTYNSRQIRTGIIEGINLIDSQDDSDIFYNFDNQYTSLDLYELKCMFLETFNNQYGITQLENNGDFVEIDGKIKFVWTNENGELHYFDEEGGLNGK